jgi:carbonic anhydrase
MNLRDELLAANEKGRASYNGAGLTPAPRKHIAIVACMDARFDPLAALGLEVGDAHVIRNAGGLSFDDTIRSLMISQRLLGTKQIVLVHHTDCGMERFSDEELAAAVEQDTGHRPEFPLGSYRNVVEDVQHTAQRIAESPFLTAKEVIGFVFDVESGALIPVDL